MTEATRDRLHRDLVRIGSHLGQAHHHIDKYVDPLNIEAFDLAEIRRLTHRALHELDQWEARRTHDLGPLA